MNEEEKILRLAVAIASLRLANYLLNQLELKFQTRREAEKTGLSLAAFKSR